MKIVKNYADASVGVPTACASEQKIHLFSEFFDTNRCGTDPALFALTDSVRHGIGPRGYPYLFYTEGFSSLSVPTQNQYLLIHRTAFLEPSCPARVAPHEDHGKKIICRPKFCVKHCILKDFFVNCE